MINNFMHFITPKIIGVLGLLFSEVALCSVESSLTAIQSKMLNTILPLVAILGLLYAAFSFVAGGQNARTHLVLAIFGAAIGFGAPAILELIRSLVH